MCPMVCYLRRPHAITRPSREEEVTLRHPVHEGCGACHSKSHRTARPVALSNVAVDGLTPSRIHGFFADLQIRGLRTNHRSHFAQRSDPEQREPSSESHPNGVAEREARLAKLHGVCLKDWDVAVEVRERLGEVVHVGSDARGIELVGRRRNYIREPSEAKEKLFFG